jgi:superfamily II DNA or RNA helicase
MNTPVAITVGNSMSKITGVTPQELTLLRSVLSYKVDPHTAKFIPNPANHVKYLMDLKGNFPTGLLHYVTGVLQQLELKFDAKAELPTRPIVKVSNRAFKSTYAVKPYKHQVDALNAATALLRGCFSMPTGSGKSIAIAMIIERLKLKTLVVVPTLELKIQLIKTLTKALTSMEHITVENIDSTSLKTKGDYDMLILDEAHHVAASTYQKLNKTVWTGISHRYCFTATPFRNNKEEQLLYESIAGRIIYEFTYKQAVEAGCIVPIKAYYYEVTPKVTDAYTYRDVYNDLVVSNGPRNDLIAGIIKGLKTKGKSVLCLVREIKHGDTISVLTNTPFTKGTDDLSRRHISKFSSGEVKALIATEGIVGEGVDTKACEYVIIAGIGKAKSSFMQKCGRAVRTFSGKESAKVIILLDKSHKFTKSHFVEQKKILKEEYGIDVIKLDPSTIID